MFPLDFCKSTMLLLTSLVVSIFPELTQVASLRFDNSDCDDIDGLPSVNPSSPMSGRALLSLLQILTLLQTVLTLLIQCLEDASSGIDL